MTPSPAETTGSEMRSIRAEGLLRLGMTMGDRRAGALTGGEEERGGEWEGGEGGGYYGGWGNANAVESVAALSLRDDVDYSRPVAAVSFSFPEPLDS